MNTIEEAVKDSGGPSAVAERMGISVQRICNWIDRGVPVSHAAALETAVDRRACRWHMFPGTWHLIWPELIGTDGAPEVPAGARAVA